MNLQLVADVLRTVAIPVSVFTAAVSLRVVVDHTYRTRSQLLRFLGLALVTTSLALGQYHSLGKPPFWPALVPLWVGLGLSVLGVAPLLSDRARSESLRPKDVP